MDSHRIDEATGAATWVGDLGVDVSELGLAFDDDGVLWMATKSPPELFRVDTTTGAASSVGPLGVETVDALAWDGHTLYALKTGDPSDLLTIDRSSGAASLVGPLKSMSVTFESGLTADKRGGCGG